MPAAVSHAQAGRPHKIKLKATGNNVYLGTTGVTSSNGYLLATTDAPLDLELRAGSVLHAIAAAGTATLHIISG